MGGVVVPGAHQKDDLLTTVLKGVAIAKDVYGIKTQADASERVDAEEKRKSQERDFAAKGGLSPLQKATLYGQGAEFSDSSPAGPGATKVYIGTPEQNTPMFMTVRRSKAPATVVNNANIGGKYGTATYDPEKISPTDPNAGLIGFTETKQRDPLPRNPVGIRTVDASGNPITKFVDPVAGMTLPSPKTGTDPTAKEDSAEEKIAYAQFEKLDKQLRVDDKSSRSAIGVAANKLQGADRLLGYVETTPEAVAAAKSDPKAKAALIAQMDHLTPQKKAEVVMGLMAQLGTGVGSLAQFEHLNAETIDQKRADLIQYFTGNTAAANAGSMIVDNLFSVKNERDISNKVIQKYYDNAKNGSPVAFRHPKTKADSEKRFNDAVSQYAEEAAGGAAPVESTAAAPRPASGTATAAPAGTAPQLKPGDAVRVKDGKGGIVTGHVEPDGIHIKFDDIESQQSIPPQGP